MLYTLRLAVSRLELQLKVQLNVRLNVAVGFSRLLVLVAFQGKLCIQELHGRAAG